MFRRFVILSTVLLLAPLARADEPTSRHAVGTVGLTRAEKRSDELDQLFGKLRNQDSKAQDRIWELWAQSDSATADILLQQATKAISGGETKIALAILDQIVKSYPDFAEAYNKRAALHFMKGNNEDALADLNRVLDIEPRHFDAMAGRGLVLEEMGKDKDAIQALRDALLVNPSMDAIKAALRILEKKSPEI